MFLQNCWYAVAWDYEIRQAPFARTICNEEIVFYRKPDRGLVALEDCCPHRLLPLSSGRVDGAHIVCGYHGLTLDGNGTCIAMPHQENVCGKKLAKSYPVAERHRFVWVWIGDPALADTNSIPDLHWCSNPDWAHDGGSYHVACDYRLLIDNLMDLTHETYVHPTSIGQVEITESPMQTTSDDNTATVTRWMRNIKPPPFWAANLKSNAACDRWQICNFSLPANVLIDVGVALAGTGAPDGDRSQGITGIVIDLMTPETETTTWYHWGMARNFETDNQALTVQIRDAQAAVFAEDIAVLEAQQRSISARPERNLCNFKIDKGGVAARRILEKHIAAANRQDKPKVPTVL